jgi:ABC-type transport system involved in multi-copper enzyme maturation permease subunit
MMRAFELLKETLVRKTFIWVTHLCCFITYGVFWLLFLPSEVEVGEFLFLWGGLFLPLALSAGIFGDDIASGRICVLVTRPFWSGSLYLYRFLGLALQGTAHLVLAALMVWVLHVVTGRGSMSGLGLWFFSSWLLFNVWAALSTTVSVVIKRAHGSLFLFVAALTFGVTASILIQNLRGHALESVVTGLFTYPFPPFELLHDLGKGEYAEDTVTVGGWQIAKGVAYAAHSLILTVIYAAAGIVLLSRRQFSSERE